MPPATFTERVFVRVINVDVVVTDRSGRSVTGLGRDDFELRVDGEPVPISNFYAETAGSTERPSSIQRSKESVRESSLRSPGDAQATRERRSHVVILIDHTRLRASNRKRAFAALRQAIEELGENDLVAVVGVEGGLVFYSDFLFDRQAVLEVLDRVSSISRRSDVGEVERRQIFGQLARGQSGGVLGRTATADPNAMISRIRAYAAEEYAHSLRSMQQIEAVVSTLAGLPGRKLLLYVGEGIPTRPGEGLFVEWRNRFGGDAPNAEIGLRRTDFNTDYRRAVGRYDLTQQMQELATAANRAGVTLYSVDAEGSHGHEIRSALTEQGATSETVSVIDENFRAPLEYTSQATGGRLLRSSGMLAEQLVEMVDGLRTFYSLGFTPPPQWKPGSDHEVEVEVRGEGLVVRHRETVRLHAPDELEASATIAALLYHTLENPLGLSAAPGDPDPRDEGETAVLPVDLELQASRLGFVPQEGKHLASISIYVTTKDAAGNPGRVQKLPFHLAIPSELMDDALRDSAHYSLPVVLRPGDRQVAIGVRDNVSGLFSAIRIDVSELSRF